MDESACKIEHNFLLGSGEIIEAEPIVNKGIVSEALFCLNEKQLGNFTRDAKSQQK